MKLLYCTKCGDIFNMSMHKKECTCGGASGLYVDMEHSVYTGKNAVCLGINNFSLEEGIYNIPLDGKGVPLDAYIIPYYCGSTIRVKSLKKYIPKKTDDSIDRFFQGLAIRQDWDRELDNVRIKNPFLKLIYKTFKKYIFISLPE